MKKTVRGLLTLLLTCALLFSPLSASALEQECTDPSCLESGHVHEHDETLESEAGTKSALNTEPEQENGSPPAATEGLPANPPDESVTEEESITQDDVQVYIARSDASLQENYNNFFAEDKEFIYERTSVASTESIYGDDVWATSKSTYYVQNNIIYCADLNGGNAAAILRGKDDISNIVANAELLFFYMDGTEYRVHLATGIAEAMLSIENPEFIRPYSSHGIYWAIRNPVFSPGDNADEIPSLLYFYYNHLTGEISTDPPDNMLTATMAGYSPDYTSTSTITFWLSGKSYSVPCGNYPRGTYFNKTGGGSVAGVAPIGVKSCSSHTTTAQCINYNGSSQCKGFARYIFKTLYGFEWNQRNVRVDVQGYPGETFWRDTVKIGSIICSSSPNGNPDGHTYLIVGRSATGITIYHANWGDGCRVSTITMTFAEAAQEFSYIDYWEHPSNTPHTHDCTILNKDGTHHWYECNYNGCSEPGEKTEHTFSYIIEGQPTGYHLKKCQACGWCQPQQHDLTIYESQNNETHKKKCVCGVSSTPEDCTLGSYQAYNEWTHMRACIACGYYILGQHTKSGWTSRDGTYHMRTCTLCGLMTDLAAHSMSRSGHYNVCGTCGYSVYLACVYNGNYVYYSSSQHRQACAYGCGAYIYGSHSYYKSGHSNICAGCGHTYTLACSYSAWYYLDGVNHRRVCSVGGCTQYGTHSGSFTITTTKHSKNCSTCGGTLVPSANHTFNANNTCTVCGYYSKHVINSIDDPIAVIYYQEDGYSVLSPLENIFKMRTGKRKVT